MSGRCRPSSACASIVRSTSGASGAKPCRRRRAGSGRPASSAPLPPTVRSGSWLSTIRSGLPAPWSIRAARSPIHCATRSPGAQVQRLVARADAARGSDPARARPPRRGSGSRYAVRDARRRAPERATLGRLALACSRAARSPVARGPADGAYRRPEPSLHHPVAAARPTGAVNAPVIRHPATTDRHGDPRTGAISYLPETQRNRTSAETARTVQLSSDRPGQPLFRRVTPVLHCGASRRSIPATRSPRRRPCARRWTSCAVSSATSRVELGELVILGANAKLAQLRADRETSPTAARSSPTASAAATSRSTSRPPTRSAAPAGRAP